MNTTHQKLLVTTLLSALSTLSPAFAAPVVGQIEDFSCLSHHYLLTRDKQPLSTGVKIFTELQNGDVITLDSKQIALQFNDEQGHQTTVTYQDFPVTVKATTIDKLEWSCKPDYYTIARQQASLPLSGNSLQTGDLLQFALDRPLLQVKLSAEVAKAVNLPYTVHVTQSVPTWPGHVAEWVISWFTKQHDNELKAAISLKTRGDAESDSKLPTAPYITLLKTPKQQLLAGQRTLSFAWKLGTPPFTLTLEHNGETWKHPGLSGQQTQQSLSLTPGDYQVSLSDAGQKEPVHYTFTVVEAKAKPTIPNEMEATHLPDESLRLVIQATWLAGQDGGKWAFEAYQQVAAIAKDYPPARLLQDALARGERVKIPK